MDSGPIRLSLIVHGLTNCLVPDHRIFYYVPTDVISYMLKSGEETCLALAKRLSPESGENLFYKTGVVCQLEQDDEGEGGRHRYLLTSLFRAKVDSLVLELSPNLWRAKVTVLEDEPNILALEKDKDGQRFILACVQVIYNLLARLIKKVPPDTPLYENFRVLFRDLGSHIRDIDYAYKLAWITIFNLDHISTNDKQDILATNMVIERLQKIIDILEKELQIFTYVGGLAEGDVPSNGPIK